MLLGNEQGQLLRRHLALWIGVRLRQHLVQVHALERSDRQDLQQRVHRGLDAELPANDRDQHVHRDRDPELGLDGVLGGAVEALDAKILFSW